VSTRSDSAARMPTSFWLNLRRISLKIFGDSKLSSMAAGAFRSFGSIAPDFGGESERMG